MAITHDTPRVRTALFSRIASGFQAALEAGKRRRLFKQTCRELGALSNRELADLGLHRSMITDVARGATLGL